MLRFFMSCLFLIGLSSMTAQTELNVFSFEQLDSLQRQEARPVVVFLNTDWCRYCRKMEHVTFQDEWIATTLNEHCYFVSQNAMQKEAINYKGKTFRYKPTGVNTGVHELAEALTMTNKVAKLTFPTTVILDPSDDRLFLQDGYLDKRKMRAVLAALLDKDWLSR